MANFDRSGMTQAGINLMGKAIGGATIQFTKLVLGDGEMTGEILNLQGVVSPKQNVDVTRIERNDNQCTVGGALLTSSVKQGFFWRECGLYAMDPDVGEILYNYAYSTKPDFIAGSDSGMLEEILVAMVATVGSNTNVNITIDDSMVFATKRELNVEADRITAAELSISKKRDKGVKITRHDLDTSMEDSKIRLVNLSDEVREAIAGTSPVLPTINDGDVTREKIANSAINTSKIVKNSLPVNFVAKRADWNFNTNKLTLLDAYIYCGNWYTSVMGETIVDISLKDHNRGYLYFDTSNSTFYAKHFGTNEPETSIILASYRAPDNYVDMVTTHTINGKAIYETVQYNSRDISNIYLRYGNLILEDVTEENATVSIVQKPNYKPSLYLCYYDGSYQRVDIPIEFYTFNLQHNNMLALNKSTSTFEIKAYGGANRINPYDEVILLLNVNGTISGALSSKAFIDTINRERVSNKTIDAYVRSNDMIYRKISDSQMQILSSSPNTSIYMMFDDASYTSVQLGEYGDYIMNHNDMLVYNLKEKALKIVRLPEKLDKIYDVLLLGCVDGVPSSGYLSGKIKENVKQQVVKTSLTKECLFKFKVNLRSSYMSDHCFVGDELWVFPVSNDEHTDYTHVMRYSIDLQEQTATEVGAFRHNWGHVNSIDYNSKYDTLICGNGSGVYGTAAKIFIFENASRFRSVEVAEFSENVLEIDCTSLGWGDKLNVVWGESNNGMNNICYCMTNDNKNIRRVLLGQGTVALENGTFIEGKSETQFNGTFKVLAEFSQINGDDVNQGSHFQDGVLYIALGHDAIWYSKNYLGADGYIEKEIIKEFIYDNTGNKIPCVAEGIAMKDGKTYLGLANSGYNWIYVY